MPHIALIAYELETGGISRVAVHLANGFCREGYRVSLVLSTSQGPRHNAELALLDNAVEVTSLSDRAFGKRALGQVQTFAAMRRWLRRARPDVVVGTANNISWYTGLAVAGLGAEGPRVFIKTTNPILRKADGPALTAIRRAGYARLFGAADGVLTLSNAETRLLAEQFPAQAARFRTVYNPYLTPEIEARTRLPAIAGEGPMILALGRLAPQKNFARAIEAFALARQMGGLTLKGARLVICGEGPQRADLEALAKRLGVSDVVELPGFRDDVPDLLACADRYLMSSEYEGLPAVVIEALGAGCPVVSTDCFLAARELLDDRPGCRVTGFSAQSLAAGLVEALEEAADEAGLRQLAQGYSLQSAARSHLATMGFSPAAD